MKSKSLTYKYLQVLLREQKVIQLLLASLLALLVIETLFFAFPGLATARNSSVDFVRNGFSGLTSETGEEQGLGDVSNRLPATENREVKYQYKTTLTAYNSEASQCSGNPCITANGYNLCRATKANTVASNGLPLGTKVKIPELFGEKVFVVRDRMNSRYSKRVDVWMKDKKQAQKFGVKYATIQVLQ